MMEMMKMVEENAKKMKKAASDTRLKEEEVITDRHRMPG